MSSLASVSTQAWDDAQWALLALQVDPVRLGGVWLRAGHGPVRDRWLEQLQSVSCVVQKIPHNTDDDRLLGGIDLTASLQMGSLVSQPGMLSQLNGGIAILPMAERFPKYLLTMLLQIQEQGEWHERSTSQLKQARFGLLALDESDDDTSLAPALTDRLAMWLDLRAVAYNNALAVEPLNAQELQEVRHRLQGMVPSQDHIRSICQAAEALGVAGLRAPSWALYVASLHAALNHKLALDDEDLQAAVRLVLLARATQIPSVEQAPDQSSDASSGPQHDPQPESPPEPPSPPEGSETQANDPAPAPQPDAPADDQVLEAVLANLPQGLLDQLAAQCAKPKSAQASSGQSGQARADRLRGRPLSPRPGQPHAGARLHVLATLRAAVPKQRLRQTSVTGPRIALRSEDFHVHRFEQRRASCLIFALDASGSAAYQRLAEAKGAVEILLEQSYARRDSVCVMAFRGSVAQTLLPPTRSLVRAKKALAGLPGGGGTPMALALQNAAHIAMNLQRQGTTPTLVVLSDGRANVTLAGLGGRSQAQAEAQQWAKQWRSMGLTSLWIDTSAQPDTQAQNLAQNMGATYFPMPLVQAKRMAEVVKSLAK